MVDKSIAEATLRETALRLLRNRIADKLEGCGFPFESADLNEAIERAAERLEPALEEVADVALRPVLRRLEQTALDRAGEAAELAHLERAEAAAKGTSS